MNREELVKGLPKNIADTPDMDVIDEIKASIRNDVDVFLESDLLAECPFCGCEEPYVQTCRLGDCCCEARVICPSCHVSTQMEYQGWAIVYAPTGENITRTVAVGKAIASWNRREGKRGEVE